MSSRIYIVNLTDLHGTQSIHAFDSQNAANEYAEKHKRLGMTVHQWEM